MNNQGLSFAIRAYIINKNYLQKLINLANACFNGFWLGVLKKETLHFVDEFCYDNIGVYNNDAHNKGGLWNWENKFVGKYLKDRKSMLIVGAGGGREVLALRKSGYDADGTECNKSLREYANDLLRKEGLGPYIKSAPRDQCIDTNKLYDGLIVGYNTYMLIQGRKQRVALLKKLRNQTKSGSPILLSFLTRSGRERRYKAIVLIGNIIRWLLSRNPIEPGDDLFPLLIDTAKGKKKYFPYYVHHFTRQEVENELREGGFTLDLFSTEEYGHAVGIASESECRI